MADTKKKKKDELDLDSEIMEERAMADRDPDDDDEMNAENKDEMEKKQKELLDLLIAQGKKTGNKIPEKEMNKINVKPSPAYVLQGGANR